MKKVVHLLSTDIFAGAENMACQIIKGFENDENYEMVYVSEIGTNKTNLENRGIQYYKLDKFNLKNVKKAVKELKPDIIHSHDIRASIIASFFSKEAHIVSHIHSNHKNMRKMNLKTFLYNMFSKKMDKIIWVSNSAIDNYYYKNNVQNKSEVMYNIVSKDELLEKISEDKNEYNHDVIFLGRLTYPKNPLRIIEVVKLLKTKKSDINVALVGMGELYEDVKEKIKEYDLEENIKMYGFISNPYKILNSSKIMIMTSIYEGTPMCALEAIALGKPIISTPTDGLVDLIKNGENGYLSNENSEIAEKIYEVLSDKEQYEKMSENARKLSNRVNDVKQYKERLEKIYEK